jgi:hypothetical protein
MFMYQKKGSVSTFLRRIIIVFFEDGGLSLKEGEKVAVTG